MRAFFLKIIGISFLLGGFVVQEAQALSLSPSRGVITVDPGVTGDVVVNFTNDEEAKVILQLGVTGLKQDQAGRPIFGAGFDAAESWVVPEKSDIELGPGERQAIIFKVTVPPGATPGSHWVALAAETRPGVGGSAVVNSRLVSLLAIQVAGVVTEDLSLDAKLEEHVAVGGETLPLSVQLLNNGNIEVPLVGKVTFRSLSGRELKTTPFIVGNQLLPQAERTVEYAVVAGRNKQCAAESNTSLCAELFWPGLYKMTTSITYGKTQQVVVGEESFWYLPLWSLGGGIVLVGLVVFSVRKVRRRSMFQKYVS